VKKILFIFGIIAVIAVAIVALITYKQNTNTNKISVVTTLFPLYDFAQNIGQDNVEVSLLLPPGVEAHSFEPKPGDIVKISESDVFVYTGKFMEPWAEDIVKGIANKKLIVVDASKGINMIPGVFHDADEPAGSLDPHIWLDFDNAKIMVDNITRAISEKNPSNAQYYQQNADEYKSALSKLDNEYKTALSKCQSKEIVYGGHYAFGYLARRYGIEYIAAQGMSPDAEPTAQVLVQLVEQIKAKNIQYIFYEELARPKIAETLSKETNTKMLLLNAAHNLTKEDFENKATFLSIMKDNLKNLKIGLQCAE
jgi:zinc transport system substrate-binding protein